MITNLLKIKKDDNSDTSTKDKSKVVNFVKDSNINSSTLYYIFYCDKIGKNTTIKTISNGGNAVGAKL
jgi:hypothetical protein